MTTPTQRPASTSDARKRLAENTPAEPSAPKRCRKCSTTRVHVDSDHIECMKCGDFENLPTPAEPDADERGADITCPCGHTIENHGPWGCRAYLVPRIGNTGACCSRTPTEVVRAAGYSRTPDAHLASAKAEGAAEALGMARDSIRARITTFRGYRPDDQYMNALNDAWGLVANLERDLRARAARLREQGADQ